MNATSELSLKLIGLKLNVKKYIQFLIKNQKRIKTNSNVQKSHISRKMT